MDLFSTKVAYAGLDEFMVKVSDKIINPFIIFLFSLAILLFLWGIVEYFLNPDNEEVRTNSRLHMIWGIVGITLMLAVWVVMGWIINTLGIEGISVDEGNIEVDIIDP